MSRMICIDCEVAYKAKKCGVAVKTLFRHNTEVYQIRSADIWECPKCKKEVVSGFAGLPIAEHYDKDIMSACLKKLEGNDTQVVLEKEY